jgi:molecular chaperone GrpE
VNTDKENKPTGIPEEPVSDTAHSAVSGASGSESAPAAEVREDAPAAESGAPDAEGQDMAEAQAGAEPAEQREEAEAEAEPEPNPLQAEVDRLQAEVNDLRQSLLRVHADFDNYRKRTRQEMEDLRRFAARELLLELLPVADNFDRALDSFSSGNVEEIRAGVEMVRRQLSSVLEKYGVTPMDCVGAPFDPTRHEAVMQEPADGREAGVVVEELQKGYLLHDKVLRPALVKVTV